jgi:hypothetical protein
VIGYPARRTALGFIRAVPSPSVAIPVSVPPSGRVVVVVRPGGSFSFVAPRPSQRHRGVFPGEIVFVRVVFVVFVGLVAAGLAPRASVYVVSAISPAAVVVVVV